MWRLYPTSHGYLAEGRQGELCFAPYMDLLIFKIGSLSLPES